MTHNRIPIQYVSEQEYPDLAEMPMSFVLPQLRRLDNGFCTLVKEPSESFGRAPSRDMLIDLIENGVGDYDSTLADLETLVSVGGGLCLMLSRNIQEGRTLKLAAKKILRWVYADLNPNMHPDKFDAMWQGD